MHSKGRCGIPSSLGPAALALHVVPSPPNQPTNPRRLASTLTSGRSSTLTRPTSALRMRPAASATHTSAPLACNNSQPAQHGRGSGLGGPSTLLLPIHTLATPTDIHKERQAQAIRDRERCRCKRLPTTWPGLALPALTGTACAPRAPPRTHAPAGARAARAHPHRLGAVLHMLQGQHGCHASSMAY